MVIRILPRQIYCVKDIGIRGVYGFDSVNAQLLKFLVIPSYLRNFTNEWMHSFGTDTDNVRVFREDKRSFPGFTPFELFSVIFFPLRLRFKFL
ncbi:hypothetical protein D3C71_1707790 [compost metagenome]